MRKKQQQQIHDTHKKGEEEKVINVWDDNDESSINLVDIIVIFILFPNFFLLVSTNVIRWSLNKRKMKRKNKITINKMKWQEKNNNN